ncbi:hypothetical protein SOVF_068450 isoform C, partial [Spinacia oleracea]
FYIGSHGPYTSELKRKFGQWQEDGGTKEPSYLHFYEYVEAVKLTGDPYVPAGLARSPSSLSSILHGGAGSILCKDLGTLEEQVKSVLEEHPQFRLTRDFA